MLRIEIAIDAESIEEKKGQRREGRLYVRGIN